MTLRNAQSAIALLMLSLSAHAQTSQCPAFPRLDGYRENSAQCRCGVDLKNVRVTPPKGFTLAAACELRKWDKSTGLFEDIPARVAINLDQYDKDGNSSIGKYYFKGYTRIRGILRFEPSDGGELFFVPAEPLQMPMSTIEGYFRLFTVIPLGKYSTFKVAKSTRELHCAEARAELAIREVMVVGNDSEGAGAYPNKLDVLRISTYKPCS